MVSGMASTRVKTSVTVDWNDHVEARKLGINVSDLVRTALRQRIEEAHLDTVIDGYAAAFSEWDETSFDHLAGDGLNETKPPVDRKKRVVASASRKSVLLRRRRNTEREGHGETCGEAMCILLTLNRLEARRQTKLGRSYWSATMRRSRRSTDSVVAS